MFMRNLEMVNMRCRQWKKPPYSHTSFSYSSSPCPSPFSVLRHMQRARPCSRCPILLLAKMLWSCTVPVLSLDITAERCWSQLQNPFALEAGTDTTEMVCPKVGGGGACLRRIRQPGEGVVDGSFALSITVSFWLVTSTVILKLLLSSKG